MKEALFNIYSTINTFVINIVGATSTASQLEVSLYVLLSLIGLSVVVVSSSIFFSIKLFRK